MLLSRVRRRGAGRRKMRVNAIGDEVWPHMREKEVWQTVRAVDQQAIYADPLQFYLSAGEHEITLHYVDQPVVLGEIAFAAPRTYPSYKEKLAEWTNAGYRPVSPDTAVKLQAENSAWRRAGAEHRGRLSLAVGQRGGKLGDRRAGIGPVRYPF